ncbi:MAG TPA: trimeric intracellular cation channel family protein [Sphingomicrobium sp.]
MAAPLVPHVSDALVLLDFFGIAVFAISGALVAAERRLDLVTFVFFAVVTGVGGGTVRDLLIGAPVFWVRTNATLLICMGAALATWMIGARWSAARALLWFDAAGLAAYSAYGAAKALGYGVAPVPAFVMGVLTACAGGIIRDVLAREPSVLLRHEIYITAAAFSSGLFVALSLVGLSLWPAALTAIAAGFALRAAAIARGWSLPAYRD